MARPSGPPTGSQVAAVPNDVFLTALDGSDWHRTPMGADSAGAAAAIPSPSPQPSPWLLTVWSQLIHPLIVLCASRLPSDNAGIRVRQMRWLAMLLRGVIHSLVDAITSDRQHLVRLCGSDRLRWAADRGLLRQWLQHQVPVALGLAPETDTPTTEATTDASTAHATAWLPLLPAWDRWGHALRQWS